MQQSQNFLLCGGQSLKFCPQKPAKIWSDWKYELNFSFFIVIEAQNQLPVGFSPLLPIIGKGDQLLVYTRVGAPLPPCSIRVYVISFLFRLEIGWEMSHRSTTTRKLVNIPFVLVPPLLSLSLTRWILMVMDFNWR